jgi:hypothetical protein
MRSEAFPNVARGEVALDVNLAILALSFWADNRDSYNGKAVVGSAGKKRQQSGEAE